MFTSKKLTLTFDVKNLHNATLISILEWMYV